MAGGSRHPSRAGGPGCPAPLALPQRGTVVPRARLRYLFGGHRPS